MDLKEEQQDVYIGISMKGIYVSKRSQLNIEEGHRRAFHLYFNWIEIDNLCYSKHIFSVTISKANSEKNKKQLKYRFKMSGKK